MSVTSRPIALPSPPSIPTGDPDAPAQTFRTFVTGPRNALAYNAALTVARAPGAVHNPLYLSGDAGLGKTHLLRAIAAYLRPRLGGAEVIVVGGEDFAHEFAAHLRGGYTRAFRRRYRRAGALLVDDVATLVGRETAAEELVRTLDALREANRQIVAADARWPGAIRGLPERLRARLAAGPTAVLGSPDEATRLAMLRQGAARRDLRVPDEALGALSRRLRDHGSTREIDEALTRLGAAHFGGLVLSPEVATGVADDINRATRHPRGHARVEDVLDAVCAYYDLPRATLLGKGRAMTVAQARQVAMYLLREDAGLMSTQVGQEIGRDHSTVLHGHARVAGALDAGDTLMGRMLDSIRRDVWQGRASTLG